MFGMVRGLPSCGSMMVVGEKRTNVFFTESLTHACVLITSTSQSLSISYASSPSLLLKMHRVHLLLLRISAGVGLSTEASIVLLGPTSLKKTDSSSPKHSLMPGACQLGASSSRSVLGFRQPWSCERHHSWHVFVCTVPSCPGNPASA